MKRFIKYIEEDKVNEATNLLIAFGVSLEELEMYFHENIISQDTIEVKNFLIAIGSNALGLIIEDQEV